MNFEECFSIVYSQLGSGFNECVYHRAIEVYLRTNNIPYESELILPIVFYNHTIGNVRIDLIVDKTVIEIKSITKLNDAARIQLKNYLRLTGLSRGYLVNFPQNLDSLVPEIEVIDLRKELEETSL